MLPCYHARQASRVRIVVTSTTMPCVSIWEFTSSPRAPVLASRSRHAFTIAGKGSSGPYVTADRKPTCSWQPRKRHTALRHMKNTWLARADSDPLHCRASSGHAGSRRALLAGECPSLLGYSQPAPDPPDPGGVPQGLTSFF